MDCPRAACSPKWPVLRTYDQGHLSRIALPVGGIGTGTVSRGGRGDLRDWEIVNGPAKGFAPGELRIPGGFLVLRTRGARGNVRTDVIEGPIEADRPAVVKEAACFNASTLELTGGGTSELPKEKTITAGKTFRATPGRE